VRIAVIPARGGSKRIPRKNIRPFAGRPMIGYAIGAARESGLFEHVIVSTDDAEIAEISRSLGAETPFTRPPELSDDHTPTVPVIAHAIRQCREMGINPAEVCCLYACVPFVLADDLVLGLNLLQKCGGKGYVFPVVRFPAAIQRSLKRLPGGELVPFDQRYMNTRTQDLEPAYYDAGQFYWGFAESWLSALPVHANAHSLVLPEWRAVDIDDEDDWLRAERLFRSR
jgi:pseudaminic acid cytidylyltransferase